jgi:hypothetical protein
VLERLLFLSLWLTAVCLCSKKDDITNTRSERDTHASAGWTENNQKHLRYLRRDYFRDPWDVFLSAVARPSPPPAVGRVRFLRNRNGSRNGRGRESFTENDAEDMTRLNRHVQETARHCYWVSISDRSMGGKPCAKFRRFLARIRKKFRTGTDVA